MPELAEVERFRRRWQCGEGQRICAVEVRASSRVFRPDEAALFQKKLPGKRLLGSEARGKQLLFRFSGGLWLGVHLGMTGELRVEPAGTEIGLHDRCLLRIKHAALTFRDPRQFGRLRCSEGTAPPEWWRSLPPGLLSVEFTPAALAAFLERRPRSPIKAVLLQQERFPGIGNWMADEILWRTRLHPRRLAGHLNGTERARLYREIRLVCRGALRFIAELDRDPPKSWLFAHRWQAGGKCPRSGVELVRETVAGRTACWSPARQPPP